VGRSCSRIALSLLSVQRPGCQTVYKPHHIHFHFSHSAHSPILVVNHNLTHSPTALPLSYNYNKIEREQYQRLAIYIFSPSTSNPRDIHPRARLSPIPRTALPLSIVECLREQPNNNAPASSSEPSNTREYLPRAAI
jgi:hypothetical protein